MISHSKKFVLVTPKKTGSVSLVDSLKPYIDIQKIYLQPDLADDCYDFYESNAKILSKHNRATDYKDFILNKKYITFGSIRNPFDSIVSFWSFMKGARLIDENCSFKNFLCNPCKRPNIENMKNQNLLDFFTIDNKVVVKNYIKFEEIDESFAKFCKKTKIPPTKLPHKNKSKRLHYSHYYDDECIQVAKEKFVKQYDHEIEGNCRLVAGSLKSMGIKIKD